MTSARRAAVALAAVCFALAAAGGKAQAKTKKEHKHHHHHHHRPHGAGGQASEGRDHLKRANALAGEGDCEGAIEEYTKAFELLDDPVVLFNRGECYRRTGNGEKAADDYRAFLDKVPNAPNRAAVEAKILALEAPEPAAREATKTPPARDAAKSTQPAREAAKATPPAREATKATPPAREAAKTPPLPPPEPPKVAEESEPQVVVPPPPAPKTETKAEPAVTVRADRAEESSSTGTGGSRPWVWIALSVLAVGAAVGGYFMLRPRAEAPPETALGNYRF